jgi:2-polyprenyl-3-methyl-5-hydroxy-6-metoxy-1,4-benzoquinol methylase
MISLFDDKLHEIDKKIASIEPFEVPALFHGIPLDMFGYLLLDVPSKFSNIKGFFPSMVSNDVQDRLTGCHGIPLLTHSLSFIKTLVSGYQTLTDKDFESATILDFGCGWGRLIRLLYKFISCENIYAVDPFDESIRLCKQHGVKCNIALSEYVPRTLPFQWQFDLIYTFSVFTHLSQKTTHIVLNTLRRHISDSGALVLTVRPKEYWYAHNGGTVATNMIRVHDKKGIRFYSSSASPD